MRRVFSLTVVMVTHDVDTLMALADRVAVLADQRIVTVGPLCDVVHYPHPFVQHFFLGQTERCAQGRIAEFRSRLAQV